MSSVEPVRVIFEDLLPGETPIDDVTELKLIGISTRKQLADVEAENIRKCVVKYLGGAPILQEANFSYDWALQLHSEMYGDVWDWAGRFRQKNFNIGIPFHQIQENLFNLLIDLKTWQEYGMDLVEQAACLHHKAVEIHPFINGNGRWSRMLSNLWLAVHNHAIVKWPEESIGSQSLIRDDYITTLREADAGDNGRFIELHRRYLVAIPE